MTIGELIAVARECKGWTLRDLEKASGVSNPLISQIETGKVRDPGFTTVVRLMDALGLSLDRAAKQEREKLKILRKTGVWKPETPVEQAAVTIAAADAIRAAQREYMNDRGNETKGQAVADACAAYDELRAALHPTQQPPHAGDGK
jgi:transcriptional regulator with XRE-family HTH domain